MSLKRALTTLTAAAAIALPVGIAGAPASLAAEGGRPAATNPGVVALVDGEGTQMCSGVLVAPQWVLSFDSTLSCLQASGVTVDGKTVSNIDEHHFKNPAAGFEGGNDPSKSQTVLMKLAEPVEGVTPATLATQPPQAGETLTIAAFNSPGALATAPVKVEGHNAWLSWYGAPQGMTLQKPMDSGSAVLRGNEVVAVTLDVIPHTRTSNAEDIANLKAWVEKTVARG